MRGILTAVLCLSVSVPLAAHAAPVNAPIHGDQGHGDQGHRDEGRAFAGRGAPGARPGDGRDQHWADRRPWTGGRNGYGGGRRAYGDGYGRYDRNGRWLAYGLGGLALGAAMGSAYDGYGDYGYDNDAYDGGEYDSGDYTDGGYAPDAGYSEPEPTGYIGAYANGYSGDPEAAIDYADAPAYAADADDADYAGDGYSYSYTREQTTESYGPVYSQCYSQITTWVPDYGRYVTQRVPAAC